MADFAAMIEKERARLNGLRDDAAKRRSAIDEEIAEIDKELRAIVAYETARTSAPKGKRGGSGKRGSRQDGILSLLRGKADGLSRGDILEGLGLKGDKTGEQSVSNALGNMKKAGKIGQKDGRYMLA